MTMKMIREWLFWHRLDRCVYDTEDEYDAAYAAWLKRGGPENGYDPVPICRRPMSWASRPALSAGSEGA